MTVQAASLSPAGVSETTEEDAIYRKINWRIVPIILFGTCGPAKPADIGPNIQSIFVRAGIGSIPAFIPK